MKFKEIQSDATNYVKLKGGESIVGVFRGDPYDFYLHWLEQKSVPCTRDTGNGCELCAKGDKPKFRFKINFVTKDGENIVAKIFEQGAKVYNDLHQLAKDGYELETTWLKVSRVGSDRDTKYSIVPLPKHQVDAASLKKIEAIELHVLEAIEASTAKDEDNVPF